MLSVNDVSKLLIKYRVKNNLTQRELAKKLHISNKTICNIENEDKSVRQITLQKIAYKLNDENFNN